MANSLANAFYQIVSNKETWVNLGNNISAGINNFFAAMETVDASTGLTGGQALGKDIRDTITGLADS